MHRLFPLKEWVEIASFFVFLMPSPVPGWLINHMVLFMSWLKLCEEFQLLPFLSPEVTKDIKTNNILIDESLFFPACSCQVTNFFSTKFLYIFPLPSKRLEISMLWMLVVTALSTVMHYCTAQEFHATIQQYSVSKVQHNELQGAVLFPFVNIQGRVPCLHRLPLLELATSMGICIQTKGILWFQELQRDR